MYGLPHEKQYFSSIFCREIPQYEQNPMVDCWQYGGGGGWENVLFSCEEQDVDWRRNWFCCWNEFTLVESIGYPISITN